jgi:hypothetical protein
MPTDLPLLLCSLQFQIEGNGRKSRNGATAVTEQWPYTSKLNIQRQTVHESHMIKEGDVSIQEGGN